MYWWRRDRRPVPGLGDCAAPGDCGRTAGTVNMVVVVLVLLGLRWA
jgi:hypothetical protein